jgi:hypothetical protein
LSQIWWFLGRILYFRCSLGANRMETVESKDCMDTLIPTSQTQRKYLHPMDRMYTQFLNDRFLVPVQAEDFKPSNKHRNLECF